MDPGGDGRPQNKFKLISFKYTFTKPALRHELHEKTGIRRPNRGIGRAFA